MSLGDAVLTGVELAGVAVALALVLGSVLGQPVLLGYVTSGSMQPTLQPGDGFVAVPTPLAGGIEEGDVVVYRADGINGGRPTIHRVVDTTARGYVTRGDANLFTDQAGGEPPVRRAQVVAVALQLDGHVVAVPHLGTVVEGVRAVVTSSQRRVTRLVGTSLFLGTRGLAHLVFVVSVVAYGVAEWRDRSGRNRRPARTRSRDSGVDVRTVVAAFALLLVVGATASMAVPAGPKEFGVVSAASDAPGAGVIPAGESETATYSVGNNGVAPVVVILEPASDGVELQRRELRVGSDDVVDVTVTLTAPPRTGFFRRFIVEHRYLGVLPTGLVRALYDLHPWAPIVAIDALIAVPFYLLGVRLVGTGRIRDRSRDRGRSALGRLRRRIRRLY
ncbi:MAG: signal peptidase I [Haloferacaceae archaeon]